MPYRFRNFRHKHLVTANKIDQMGLSTTDTRARRIPCDHLPPVTPKIQGRQVCCLEASCDWWWGLVIQKGSRKQVSIQFIISSKNESCPLRYFATRDQPAEQCLPFFFSNSRELLFPCPLWRSELWTLNGTRKCARQKISKNHSEVSSRTNWVVTRLIERWNSSLILEWSAYNTNLFTQPGAFWFLVIPKLKKTSGENCLKQEKQLGRNFRSWNRMISSLVSTVRFIKWKSALKGLVNILMGPEVDPCELDMANKTFPVISKAAAA